MYSEMKYSVPEKITEGSNFSDIYLGIIKDHLEDSCCGIHPNHAAIVPVAADFFREKTSENENPVTILEKSFETQSPFIPGTSMVSIPMKSERGPYRRGRLSEQEEYSRASSVSMELEIDGESASLNRVDWERVFGQIPSAALIVAKERGFDPVIKIPSFANRFPNYAIDGLYLGNIPEGLSVGTIFIDGHVGDYCGKFSEGGRVVVNGSVGEKFGDCSRGVEYLIKEFAGKPSQVEDCDFYVGLYFRDKAPSLDIGLHEHEALKLEEKGCKVHGCFSFNKDAFKGDPSRPIEELVSFWEKRKGV